MKNFARSLVPTFGNWFLAQNGDRTSRWLCLFGGSLDESAVEGYAREGFTIIVGPDHRGFPTLSPISLVAFESDSLETARQARKMWQMLGETKSATGHSLRDDLTDEQVSLWDVCATNIILYFLQKICRNVQCVDRLFDTQRPPQLIVIDCAADLAARWIAHRAQLKGIPCQILVSGTTNGAAAAFRGSLHTQLRRWRNRAYSILRRTRDGSQGEALFLGFVDRQLDSMIPVAEEMRDREGIPVHFVLPLSSTRRLELLSKGFRCDAYETYTPRRRSVARLRRRIDRGLSLLDSDPILRAYAAELRPQLRNLLLRAAEYNALARSVCERLRPSLLVTSDVNHPLLRAFCLKAAQSGLPSINIPYGLVTPQAVEWSFAPQTAIAAMGRRSADAIASWGTVAGRIEITGSPRHDQWSAPPNGERRIRDRSSLRLPADDKIVCYLSVPADINRLGSQDGALRISEKAEMLLAVRDACMKLSGGFLMVVAHPEELLDDLNRALGSCDPRRIRVLRAQSIRQLLEVSDVAVTCHSMTGLEAILLGVPLVTINLAGRPDPVPYAADEGAIGVYDSRLVLPAIEAALAASSQPDRRERFLKRHLHRPADGSARSIATIAARMASTRDAIGAKR